MEKFLLDVTKKVLTPFLKGKGVQIGGERLNEEITRVHLFSSNTFKATGKEVTVPGETLPVFPNEEMDYIVYPLTFEGLPDPIKSLREARRVLKDKGELLIVAVDGRKADRPTFEGHAHLYTPQFLARMVELAGGFSINALREVGESCLIFLKAERDVKADIRIPFVTYTPLFVEAARTQEGCSELFFQLGILYLQIGDTRRARDSFEQVLAFEPDSAESMAGIGMAYLCEEDKIKAKEWFERAIEKDPSNSDYRKWLELAMEAPFNKEKQVTIPRPEKTKEQLKKESMLNLGEPPILEKI